MRRRRVGRDDWHGEHVVPAAGRAHLMSGGTRCGLRHHNRRDRHASGAQRRRHRRCRCRRRPVGRYAAAARLARHAKVKDKELEPADGTETVVRTRRSTTTRSRFTPSRTRGSRAGRSLGSLCCDFHKWPPVALQVGGVKGLAALAGEDLRGGRDPGHWVERPATCLLMGAASVMGKRRDADARPERGAVL